jgi:O-antigen ligase
MSEHHRALVVILVVASCVFATTGGVFSALLGRPSYARRRNLWFSMTIAAFLSPSYWIFVLVAAAILLFTRRHADSPCGDFFLLLLVVPPVAAEVPGFGLVNYIFTLSYPRLLVLCVLLPTFISLIRAHGFVERRSPWPDRFLYAYLILQVLLFTREFNLTTTLRESVYLLTDILIPYYVFSRGIRSLQALDDSIGAFCLASTVVAAVAVVETAKHWLLYTGLAANWELGSAFMYIERAGQLRAMGTAGHSLVLGYVLAVAFALFLHTRAYRLTPSRNLVVLLLLGGLAATLARGSWIGCLAALVAFFVTGANAFRNVARLAAAGVAVLLALAVLPRGDFILNLLPFIGSVDNFNVQYRERLLDSAIVVLWRNPIFGTSNYEAVLAEMGLTQGQGIVDVVNTYVQVGLGSGLVGLSLFGGFFLAILVLTLKAIRRTPIAERGQRHVLGRALVAAQVAVVVIIASLSTYMVVSWVYWIVAAMSLSYARLESESENAAENAADDAVGTTTPTQVRAT